MKNVQKLAIDIQRMILLTQFKRLALMSPMRVFSDTSATTRRAQTSTSILMSPLFR